MPATLNPDTAGDYGHRNGEGAGLDIQSVLCEACIAALLNPADLDPRPGLTLAIGTAASARRRRRQRARCAGCLRRDAHGASARATACQHHTIVLQGAGSPCAWWSAHGTCWLLDTLQEDCHWAHTGRVARNKPSLPKALAQDGQHALHFWRHRHTTAFLIRGRPWIPK